MEMFILDVYRFARWLPLTSDINSYCFLKPKAHLH